MGMVPDADGAGPHCQAAGLDPGFPSVTVSEAANFCGRGGNAIIVASMRLGAEPSCSGAIGAGLEELSAVHGGLLPELDGFSGPRLACSFDALVFKEFFCLKRRHAARAGGGDRLAIAAVLHVPAGVYAGYAGEDVIRGLR